MAILNEKTLIPVSLVVVVVGGAAWLTEFGYDAKAAIVTQQSQIAELKERVDRQSRFIIEQIGPSLNSIDQRLAHIEGKLENK